MACIIILVLWGLVSTVYAQNEQLLYVEKSVAEKAVNFLKPHKQLVIYCGCCGERAEKLKVIVEEVKFRPAPNAKDYEVVIYGVGPRGEAVHSPVDLAYIHYKKGNLWHAASHGLALKADPCIKPFRLD